MREDILPESDAGGAAGNFLEQQQDGLSLSGRHGEAAFMVAQPRDFAELAMLAKRNFILVHAKQSGVAGSQCNGEARAAVPDWSIIVAAAQVSPPADDERATGGRSSL
jgi:hypothetical protein